MEEFIIYYDSLITWFLSKVEVFKNKNTANFTRKDIILFTIKNGSINVNSGLQLQTGNDAINVANGITNSMAYGN